MLNLDMLPPNQHALQLLTENTPNGKKVQILLEELHAVYETSWATRLIDLETDEQKKSWFLRLNPNGSIPYILSKPLLHIFAKIIEALTLVIQGEFRSFWIGLRRAQSSPSWRAKQYSLTCKKTMTRTTYSDLLLRPREAK